MISPRPDVIPGCPHREQEAAGTAEAGDENDQESHLRQGRKDVLGIFRTSMGGSGRGDEQRKGYRTFHPCAPPMARRSNDGPCRGRRPRTRCRGRTHRPFGALYLPRGIDAEADEEFSLRSGFRGSRRRRPPPVRAVGRAPVFGSSRGSRRGSAPRRSPRPTEHHRRLGLLPEPYAGSADPRSRAPLSQVPAQGRASPAPRRGEIPCLGGTLVRPVSTGIPPAFPSRE